MAVFSPHRTVRTFSLHPQFLEKFHNKQPKWGPLGLFTYKRTYARPIDGNGRVEEFWETLRRVTEGVYNVQKIHCRNLGLPWDEARAQRSAQEMFQRMWDFKFLPPGRGLWMMGTQYVLDRGSAALNNCAFTSTQDIDVDFADPFCFLMDMCMVGAGVGGDTKGAGKVRIQEPRYTDKPYIVEDTREAWVELLRVVLNAFIGKGFYPTTIDYSKLRKKGEPIRGFGGVSSGAGPLMDLINQVTKLLLPEDGQPYRITSSQIVDIFNFIGKCVVAGNVRRSSEIMLGDIEDVEFLSLKQDPAALKDRRWASNNSIFGKVGMDYSQLVDPIAANGEPGIFWLRNAQKYSRMIGWADNKDFRVSGVNPCGEQSLESGEMCNLVETFPANHDTFEDYRRTLKYAYLYAKSVTLIPTHNARTNAVMGRNRRIGCSMTGIIQAIEKFGRRIFLKGCNKGYEYIQELDTKYSDWLCIPRSIKMTTVKPSGTVSLLAGATPGIHYPQSEYYIRNIRVQEGSPLIEICQRAGYPVEEDVNSPNTMVVSFPVHEVGFVKAKKDVTIWEQFANAADMQQYWADNQVSITITFKPEEIREIKPCLEHFETRLKAVTLLPLADHGYEQAPYIEIDPQRYKKMMAKIRELDLSDAEHDHLAEDKFCDGDTCAVIPTPID